MNYFKWRLFIKYFEYNSETRVFSCIGSWTLDKITEIQIALSRIETPSELTQAEGSRLTALDSAGAWLLQQWTKNHKSSESTSFYQSFDPRFLKLIQLVTNIGENAQHLPPYPKQNILATLGQFSLKKLSELIEFLNFLGLVSVTSLKLLIRAHRIPWKSCLYTLEISGVYAMPLIALLSFLIGMVLAYQMGLQLKTYGANIYIADLLGISILREFAPLMTAIIVAGRSGSALTAQLGIMKIGAEIDALTTMGISPIEILVIPKIWGLFIVMPLLTILANVSGVLGGMLVSNTMLHINATDFLNRFYTAVPVRSFWIGMVKAPTFGLAISLISCFQGFKVFGSATSIGEKTTRSVVQSIFAIIVMDAIFSVLLSELGL